MSHKIEKVSPYNIILKLNGKSESYRVSKELFLQIREDLKPFRSITNQCRLIQCLETGELFNDSYKAMRWLIRNKIANNYSACIEIRNACNGKIESAYGYHWKYVAVENLDI